MPQSIPFKPSNPDQTLEVTLFGVANLIRARWNEQDGAWYLDVMEVNEKPIIMGVKVMLGVYLGRTSTHPFFRDRALFAWDLTNSGREAGLDDLGKRVLIVYLNEADLQLMQSPPFEQPINEA